MKILGYILSLLLLCAACSQKEPVPVNSAFSSHKEMHDWSYDLDQILTTGELIMVTMSGPDTYFDYQGQPMGLQYSLVSHFAEKHGLRVRVELAHTVDGMLDMLKMEEADIICYPLPDSVIAARHLRVSGVRDKEKCTSWAVRTDAPMLADALDEWYGAGLIVTVEKNVRSHYQPSHRVRRHKKSPYLSKKKGIISSYDEHFKSAGRLLGWDWRLIAAQCYQESGFDPMAISWAGAKGLMQIMPVTAKHVGLDESMVYDPRENIAAAARYLKYLNEQFSVIPSVEERIKFVLASYNGGLGHVRDAMALTRKYGHDDHLWKNVAPFVLRLSQSLYYRDPVVKNGYMIGDETYNYVLSVWEQWRTYGGSVSSIGTSEVISNLNLGSSVRKQNKYTRGTKVYRPDDPYFKEINE